MVMHFCQHCYFVLKVFWDIYFVFNTISDHVVVHESRYWAIDYNGRLVQFCEPDFVINRRVLKIYKFLLRLWFITSLVKPLITIFVSESSNIVTEVKLLEALCFYIFLIAVKNIHSKTYSLFIDAYTKDQQEKLHLSHTIVETVPCIQRNAKWAFKWCGVTPTTPAVAAVKCVFFFLGSFCAIFLLKKHRVMPGLSFSFSNKLISQDEDEGLHCNFACQM